MIICVIDGQGGGIGAAVIKRLKDLFEDRVEIIALGTNAIATSQMLKARANKGASGENAIVRTVARADIIIGPVSILAAHSMMGEITPKMAEAIAGSLAKKILLPLTRERLEIVGVVSEPLPHLIDRLVENHIKPIATKGLYNV
ncbi:MAG: DUF3842 family protein [Deltaproteobacteria bacterium]|nr:DUF3842 family protein [Deltaproteobacteria bacterium]